MSITIKESDLIKLFEFMKWKCDNPHPCESCYCHPPCQKKDELRIYEDEYAKRIKAAPYSNMNYQKLADSFFRKYKAKKQMDSAIAEFKEEEEAFNSVLDEYTVLEGE